jgi:hypothetical protein
VNSPGHLELKESLKLRLARGRAFERAARAMWGMGDEGGTGSPGEGGMGTESDVLFVNI